MNYISIKRFYRTIKEEFSNLGSSRTHTINKLGTGNSAAWFSPVKQGCCICSLPLSVPIPTCEFTWSKLQKSPEITQFPGGDVTRRDLIRILRGGLPIPFMVKNPGNFPPFLPFTVN